MEELPVQPLHRDPVLGVADDGETDRLEVDADLVRAARLEADAQERVLPQEVLQLEVGNRVARTV